MTSWVPRVSIQMLCGVHIPYGPPILKAPTSSVPDNRNDTSGDMWVAFSVPPFVGPFVLLHDQADSLEEEGSRMEEAVQGLGFVWG